MQGSYQADQCRRRRSVRSVREKSPEQTRCSHASRGGAIVLTDAGGCSLPWRYAFTRCVEELVSPVYAAWTEGASRIYGPCFLTYDNVFYGFCHLGRTQMGRYVLNVPVLDGSSFATGLALILVWKPLVVEHGECENTGCEDTRAGDFGQPQV